GVLDGVDGDAEVLLLQLRRATLLPAQIVDPVGQRLTGRLGPRRPGGAERRPSNHHRRGSDQAHARGEYSPLLHDSSPLTPMHGNVRRPPTAWQWLGGKSPGTPDSASVRVRA